MTAWGTTPFYRICTSGCHKQILARLASMEQELKEQRALGLKMAGAQPESKDPYANLPGNERRFNGALDTVTCAIWEEPHLPSCKHVWTHRAASYLLLVPSTASAELQPPYRISSVNVQPVACLAMSQQSKCSTKKSAFNNVHRYTTSCHQLNVQR